MKILSKIIRKNEEVYLLYDGKDKYIYSIDKSKDYGKDTTFSKAFVHSSCFSICYNKKSYDMVYPPLVEIIDVVIPMDIRNPKRSIDKLYKLSLLQ